MLYNLCIGLHVCRPYVILCTCMYVGYDLNAFCTRLGIEGREWGRHVFRSRSV